MTVDLPPFARSAALWHWLASRWRPRSPRPHTVRREQAQDPRKRAEGRGYLPPHVLTPARLMPAGPCVTANHPGIRRIGPEVEGDGNVIAQPPVHRDVKGLLNIKPGQVARAGHAAANDVEQRRTPAVVRTAVLIQEIGL